MKKILISLLSFIMAAALTSCQISLPKTGDTMLSQSPDAVLAPAPKPQPPPVCGPPTFSCASHAVETVQMPSPLPSMGDPLYGVNSNWSESVLGQTYYRVTDANDAVPGALNKFPSFIVPPGAINADSTMFFVQLMGGAYELKTWDTVKHVAGRTGLTFADGDIIFDNQTPTTVWIRKHNTAQIWTATVDKETWQFTNLALAFDFETDENCLPNYGKVTWAGIFASDLFGKYIGISFSNTGGQETGTKAVVYSPGKGCSVLDTSTMIVSGDWGQTGQAEASHDFLIHDTQVSPGGWVSLSGNDCVVGDKTKKCSVTYFWMPGTTTVLECGTWPFSAPFCDQHAALGYNRFLHGGGKIRAYAEPNVFLATIYPVRPVRDTHSDWPENAFQLDTMPEFEFNTWVKRPDGPNTGPFENQIVGLGPLNDKQVANEGFNWNSGYSPYYQCQNAMGKISHLGDLILVASDGMGNFGSLTGNATCDYHTGTCRCDIIAIVPK